VYYFRPIKRKPGQRDRSGPFLSVPSQPPPPRRAPAGRDNPATQNQNTAHARAAAIIIVVVIYVATGPSGTWGVGGAPWSFSATCYTQPGRTPEIGSRHWTWGLGLPGLVPHSPYQCALACHMCVLPVPCAPANSSASTTRPSPTRPPPCTALRTVPHTPRAACDTARLAAHDARCCRPPRLTRRPAPCASPPQAPDRSPLGSRRRRRRRCCRR